MTTPTVLAIMHEEDARKMAGEGNLAEALGDTPWRLACAAQLAAVVADLTTQQLEPTRANLAWWLESLRRLGIGRAIVPMRFGQAADDRAEIERFLTCRQEHLRSVLHLVGHRVELVVRITATAPRLITPVQPGQSLDPTPSMQEVKPTSAGRRFLLGRKREMFLATGGDDAAAAENIVRAALGNLAIALMPEPPSTALDRGGVCVLIDQNSSSEAVARIRAEATESNNCLHITGPLPPLGFAAGSPGTSPPAATVSSPSPTAFSRPGAFPCER